MVDAFYSEQFICCRTRRQARHDVVGLRIQYSSVLCQKQQPQSPQEPTGSTYFALMSDAFFQPYHRDFSAMLHALADRRKAEPVDDLVSALDEAALEYRTGLVCRGLKRLRVRW